MTAAITLAEGPVVIDLYCRISADYDGTMRSVEDQEAMGREAVAALGYEVGVVYRDHALSGWNPKVKRPEWDALMARLESGASHGVWVRDLDRFTRKMHEAERLLQAAQAGAVVVARHSSYDLTSARGKRQFREDAVDAAYESDRISERSSRGKQSRVLRGRSNASRRGFGRAGYLPNPEGWEPGDARVPVPEQQVAAERAAVREAVDALLTGASLDSVARGWNETGLLTANGCLWDGAAVRQFLEFPSVAGHLTHKGQIVGRAEGEPILDPARWDRLMLMFASRKRGSVARQYLLSGILRCGKCGGVLYGRPQTSRRPYPDGETARSYWCQVRLRDQGGCGSLTIDMRLADATVRQMVEDRLSDPAQTDRITRLNAKAEAAHVAAYDELARLNAEADSIASKAGQPGWTLARLDATLAAYAPLIEEAEARLHAVAQAAPVGAVRADAAAAWSEATLAERRTIVRRTFPEGLTVLPSKSRGVGAQNEDRVMVGTYPLPV